MSTYDYKPGLGNVGSYQVSGVPYVNGAINATSEAKLTFPSVTSWIVVSNADGNGVLKIGFSSLGLSANGNFLELADGAVSPRLEVKVTELYLLGSNNVSVMAGLTGITRNRIDNNVTSPDGTNWSGSAGALVG
ncbi:MAG TPA: hypothetical protein EYN67_09110 [Flavobacteriales bacterium]|nr:hypothetical protein [Flavobacteriales bacterium]